MKKRVNREAEMLRKARLKMGYSQQQVATLVGMHIRAYQRLEYTHATRRLDTVEERLDEADLLVEKPASGQFVNGGYWRAGSALQPVNQPYYLISLFPVSDQVIKTKTASGYKMTAFAFSSAGTFDGFLHAYNTFTTTSTKDVYWTDEINFSELREKYPTDHFLIEVASDTTISGTLTEITTAEEANVTYVLSPCDTEPRAYYMAELAATIQSVRDALTEPALVFPMVTDIHYLALNNTFDYCIDNIKAFCKAVKCDFLLNLGDNTDGNTAQTVTLARNEYMLWRFAEIDLPYYFVTGNHDTNYKAGSSAIFSEEQMFKSYLANTRGVVFDMTEGENNYYKDFDELGIRLICLDANHLQQYTYSERTPTWLSEVALQTDHVVLLCIHLSNSTSMNPDGQGILPQDTRNAVISALRAFVNNGGTIIQLCGHSHADYSFTTPWLTIFSTCQKFQQADVTASIYTKITGYDPYHG